MVSDYITITELHQIFIFCELIDQNEYFNI